MSTMMMARGKGKICEHRNVGRVVTDELLNTLIKNAVAGGKIDSSEAKGTICATPDLSIFRI